MLFGLGKVCRRSVQLRGRGGGVRREVEWCRGRSYQIWKLVMFTVHKIFANITVYFLSH
jgi:hypothetical protein